MALLPDIMVLTGYTGYQEMNGVSTDMQPLISIIVPVYGAEKYIKRCVDSLCGQTYTQIEIILADDGSRDNGGALCDCFAQQDSRIHVLHKENGGLVSAWMAGTEISSGEYLCYVDSDDWIEPGMVAALAEHLTWKKNAESRNEIICSNFLIDHADDTLPQPRNHELPPGTYEGEQLRRQVLQNILGNENRTVSLSRCMKLFSRNLILQNMHYCDQTVQMGEDVVIVLPALLDCCRLVILSEHYDYHYYFNPASMVHHYDIGLYRNLQKLRNIMETILAQKYDALDIRKPIAKEAVSREYCYLFCLVLKNELRSGLKGAPGRMKYYCKQEHMGELLQQMQVTSEDSLNRILFFYMKHPSAMLAACMCLGIRIADRLR